MDALPRRTRIKVCGVVRPKDAVLAAQLGADAIGVNFHPKSPRCVSPLQARQIALQVPAGVDLVGVFVDEDAPAIRRIAWDVGFSTIQLHGDELAHQVFRLAPFRIVKAFRWKDTSTATEIDVYVRSLQSYRDEATGLATSLSAILVDSFRLGQPGGTGAAWNWGEAADVVWPAPVIVAGGLHADNVGDAISTLQPYGVDVASGVESEPGVKDANKLKAFFEAVRAADER
jgi:phosphoribosylanthranilate isomerase